MTAYKLDMNVLCVKAYNVFFYIYYPCNSIKALNMGCIDDPHPHIICRYTLERYRLQGYMGHTDVWGGIWT